MNIDVLIIGQGIAGTVLGETFFQKGKTVLFIDQGHQKSSSIIASGMYNPVGFKRINKTWMIEELLPFSENFYQQLNKKLGHDFIHTYEILKFFANEAYRTAWDNAAENNGYMSKSEINYSNPLVKNEFGFGRVVNCGRLELKIMLKQYRSYLQTKRAILHESYNPDLLDIKAGKYRDINFKHLIFCQGHEGAENKYFNNLPLQKTKGELLRIKAVDLQSFDLLNKGFFVVPVGNDEYVVGSTYSWTDSTPHPTKEGKNQILEKLKKLYKGSFDVIEHSAGIRPTLPDRKPLIGLHPEHKNLGIFNGLGSKGVLIAPFFSNHFAEHLLHKRPLNPEVDINRFN